MLTITVAEAREHMAIERARLGITPSAPVKLTQLGRVSIVACDLCAGDVQRKGKSKQASRCNACRGRLGRS